MENMTVEYCNDYSNGIEEIKHAERSIFLNNQDFEEAMYFWNRNVVEPSPLKLIANDQIRRKELLGELRNENSLAKIIEQDKDSILEQPTIHTQMRDLQKQETSLKTNIENIEHRIQKLKSIYIERNDSKIQKKLEMQRNFVKVSKKFTGASFEYQGSDISGFIRNGNNFQVFDFKPNKSNEDVSKYIWECLNGATTVNWVDIFVNDNI